MREDITGNLHKLHFTDNWLTWAALHHFLPAPLLRELSYVIVDQMSDGSLSLDQLFNEAFANDFSDMDSWLVQPRDTDSTLATYLQNSIRAFVWQGDPGSIGTPEESGTTNDKISPMILNKAIELGAADFSSLKYLLIDVPVIVQPSFTKFVDAIKKARVSFKSLNNDDFWMELKPHILTLNMPLAAVVVKHLGDLCADSDAWDKAQVLYEQSKSLLAGSIDPTWNEFTSSLNAIIIQSLAAATRTLNGTKQAAEELTNVLDKAYMQDNRLLLANASYDAMVAAMHSSFEKGIAHDRRSALLLPPLLHKTHNISAALEAWLNSKFTDAHRRFWAVLRRQVALGSATESRATKSLYARSILEDIDQKIARQSQPQNFQLSLRLLLESGDSKSAAQIRWNDQLVDMYVDQQCVRFVVIHAQVHIGSKLERQSVVLELFREWSERITPARTDVAVIMLKYITELALEPSTLSDTSNLGGRSLEALQSIARKRPELRQSNALEVAIVISEKLRLPGFWTGRKDALDTALAYVDVFSDESLHKVINSTLIVLDETNPETGMWPIVQPALNLLISEPVKRLSGLTPELGQRIVSTILYFGLNQESENANVLFYLYKFDSALLRDVSVRDKLNDAVIDVRRKAAVINSSNVVANIQALLLAPAISGSDGVKDALNGLTLILSSATERHPSIAFPHAYSLLLLLVGHFELIANDILKSPEEFRLMLQPLVPLIIDIWDEAKKNPLIFAPFSFSEVTKPDPVVVHNWAFASSRFAECFGQNEELQEALTVAAMNPVLSNDIALAHATKSVTGEDSKIDINAIRAENRDAFYTTLGRKLVVLHRLDDEQAYDLCMALLDQCFRLGPRELDAAVLLSAVRLNLGDHITDASYSDYRKRVENSRDLHLSLAPILHMFEEKRRKD